MPKTNHSKPAAVPRSEGGEVNYHNGRKTPPPDASPSAGDRSHRLPASRAETAVTRAESAPLSPSPARLYLMVYFFDVINILH
jgi:hypothetical protein